MKATPPILPKKNSELLRLNPFKLERFFAKYEFNTPYLLCCSDCQALPKSELLSYAEPKDLKLWNDLTFGYTESQGHPVLRQEITSLYRTISSSEVMVAIPEECIFLYMNSILEPGDHVITTYPGYQSLYEIGKSLQCRISTWEPREEKGWHFNIQDLIRKIEARTKLLVLNFPHNPTGSILNKSDVHEIIKIAEEQNIQIFSDEMYRFLEYDPNSFNQSLCDLTPQATSLFGLSKTFSLPGLRIGWLTTKNQAILKKVSAMKDYTSICNNAAGEILAIIALKAKNRIIKKNLTRITGNLKKLDMFFIKYNRLFQFNRPKAGPIAFVRFKGAEGTSAFCKELIDQKGVMLLPSEVYDYGDRHFRIGFARDNFAESLQIFENFLESI